MEICGSLSLLYFTWVQKLKTHKGVGDKVHSIALRGHCAWAHKERLSRILLESTTATLIYQAHLPSERDGRLVMGLTVLPG